MNEILGQAKTIRELLSGTKYAIDYYQREYKWQTKQVLELLNDLSGKFLADYDPEHERDMVQAYGHYFLGSIIISRKNGKSYIIDGQQRLTTLTLLLIYLHSRTGDREDVFKLDELIYSERFGKKSFNLDVDERATCMEALFSLQPFDDTDRPESVRNIMARYNDIEQSFPDDANQIDEHALPFFVDWLIENVHLVEITAYSDEDAYTIFETMNDRGLSLTPTDMLKGYVMANITDEKHKIEASRLWKERVGALAEFGKDEDADAFKTWLRSQYAETIRERKKGAQPGDFDRLGTEFHRWVREHEESLGLKKSTDFFHFVQHDLNFYTRQYYHVREASRNLMPGLECIFYNAQYEFTLQYPLLLAPLDPEDDEQIVDRKLRIVSSYVDILLARRLWNFRSISYSTVQYAMFLVMREIRGKSPSELVETFSGRLADVETFASNPRFMLHKTNGYTVKQFLARMTDHVERASGLQSRYLEYIGGKGVSRYEIEHIWANHPERHTAEFSNATDFAEYRNRIGGLLLLPKPFNASFGDLPYDKKLEQYNGQQNLLTRSLHLKCYDHNPRFLSYVSSSGLPFKAHPQFMKADLDARQDLYRQIAEEIWNPARLEQEAAK